jgi:hypothetical protein
MVLNLVIVLINTYQSNLMELHSLLLHQNPLENMESQDHFSIDIYHLRVGKHRRMW